MEVQMREYPYTPLNFAKNTRSYGIGPALREDWAVTKEHISYEIRDATIDAVLAIGVVIAIPTLLRQEIALRREYRRIQEK